MDLCFELATQAIGRLGAAVSPVDEVHGFRFFDLRSIVGFVDGTENPRTRRRSTRRSSETKTRPSRRAAT